MNSILERVNKVFVNSFLARFGPVGNSAKQILNDVCDAPHRLLELQADLVKLYMESVGEEGLDDCLIAIIYAGQLSFYQMQVVPESLPVLEIEQSNVNDTDSPWA